MIRPAGKAQKIAQAVMKQKGVKIPKSKYPIQKMTLPGPYLLHWGIMAKAHPDAKQDKKLFSSMLKKSMKKVGGAKIATAKTKRTAKLGY